MEHCIFGNYLGKSYYLHFQVKISLTIFIVRSFLGRLSYTARSFHFENLKLLKRRNTVKKTYAEKIRC